MDMKFGTWNFRSLYRTGSLKTVASELLNSDVVAVQEVRWVKTGSQPADDCTFFYGNGNVNCHLEMGLFVQWGIISS
jgi:hypothetical protein